MGKKTFSSLEKCGWHPTFNHNNLALNFFTNNIMEKYRTEEKQTDFIFMCATSTQISSLTVK